MVKTTKGLRSKQEIVATATDILNRKGIQTTLRELAAEMGQNISHITNHFRTKDHLIKGIAEAYEEAFQATLARFGNNENLDFETVKRLFSAVMDVQYAYRSAIIAVFASSNSQKVLYNQTMQSYARNRDNIRAFAEALVAAGLIERSILEQPAFAVFQFQFVNLFMAWLVNLELYDADKGYAGMKPVYLEGIMRCFWPHLTPEGRTAFDALRFDALHD